MSVIRGSNDKYNSFALQKCLASSGTVIACRLKACTQSCCSRPAFVPHVLRHHFSLPLFPSVGFSWISDQCRRGLSLGVSVWCSMHFSWLEHEALHPESSHTTSNSNAGLFWASSSLLRCSSSARRVTGSLPGRLPHRSQGDWFFIYAENFWHFWLS